MKEPFERLQEARRRAGYGTPTDAARAFGWNAVTYRSHDNGGRGIKPSVASQYARAFRVSAGWLLTGRGSIDDTDFTTVPLLGLISAGGAIDVSTDQTSVGSIYEAALLAIIPEATMAFQIIGTSMLPVYQPDSLIVCGDKRKDFSRFVGDTVAVSTTAGEKFLKTIYPGSRPNRWHLESTNDTLMMDIQIDWIAEIVAIIPAKQWRKIERDPKLRKIGSLDKSKEYIK